MVIPRAELTFLPLALPELGRSQFVEAVRLQLTQYLPPGLFAFACRRSDSGSVQVWAWPLKPDGPAARRRADPEPLFDRAAADGLRLLRRSAGFEAQFWRQAELVATAWFAQAPDAQAWQRFARGCGVDPELQPVPLPTEAPALPTPARGWSRGDNLPAADPWQGWRWQAAVVIAGALVAAAIGIRWQTDVQLAADTQRLQALANSRDAALDARANYEKLREQLESLRALVPRLSQLELLDRVTNSGVFAPRTQPAAAPVGLAAVPGAPAPPPAPAVVRLREWDYRAGQLKLTLELPDREMTLLDITRRIERIPGLTALRVGQDGSGNALTLSATIPELAAPGLVSAAARSGANATPTLP